MSQLIPPLKPTTSTHLHKPTFFAAMYLISVATGLHKPSLESFGADQFDDRHPAEHLLKPSFFNHWNLALCSGLLLGVTLIAFLEDAFNYGLAAIALTATMLLSLLLLLLGRPFYRFRAPQTIPFTVEQLKLVLPVVPIWLTALPFGVSVTQTSTFFVKQGSVMNRSVVAGFDIPPASVYAFGAVAMIVTVMFYEKILVPVLRRITGNERGMSVLTRVGIGMGVSVAAMATAAVVERRRMRVEGEMSVFWLAPQFAVFGIGDGFAIVGLQEYFYGRMPEGMRGLGISLYIGAMGAASFLSSGLITVVDRVTGGMEGGSWFGEDLNGSRLDLFYWLLALVNGVNLCLYVFVARRCECECLERRVGVSGLGEREEGVAVADL